ncbi:MAG: hypothetical protein J7501_08640 [Bdellovibrio sp.]|nr:hypothetical protein [Bdellovibrio sp.]
MLNFKVLVLSVLGFSGAAQATPVYKYVLQGNDVIADKCVDDGEKIASKINLSFSAPATDATQMRLRVKACTIKLGLKKLSFNFNIPVKLLNEEFLLALPMNHTQKVGENVWVTREVNNKNTAVFSIAPASFGQQADGVTMIRFTVALDPKDRRNLMDLTHEKFMWSGLHIVYKKGFLMPNVILHGDLKLVEEE